MSDRDSKLWDFCMFRDPLQNRTFNIDLGQATLALGLTAFVLLALRFRSTCSGIGRFSSTRSQETKNVYTYGGRYIFLEHRFAPTRASIAHFVCAICVGAHHCTNRQTWCRGAPTLLHVRPPQRTDHDVPMARFSTPLNAVIFMNLCNFANCSVRQA